MNGAHGKQLQKKHAKTSDPVWLCTAVAETVSGLGCDIIIILIAEAKRCDTHCFTLHRSCPGCCLCAVKPIFNFYFGIFYDRMVSSVHEEKTASISSKVNLSNGDESGENEPINVRLRN